MVDDNNEKLKDLLSEFENESYLAQSTYEIISKFAYLIGIKKSIFENEHEPPKLEIFNQLKTNKKARIIRNLCMLRTALEQNFSKINNEYKATGRSIPLMKEYVPYDAVMGLQADGISVFRKQNKMLNEHVMEINRLIGDRLNNCRDIFPDWLNWEYLKDLFIMPRGTTKEGLIAEVDKYYKNKNYYPYQVYMHWEPYECGNLLASDKKFIRLLYFWHDDEFCKLDKVQNVNENVTRNIADYLVSAKNVVFFVDCENSNTYHLCATFDGLPEENMNKVNKIILIDDVNTSTAWGVLEEHVSIPVEHKVIPRIKEDKSLVDITLTAQLCKEFYANNTDSFVLVSSDSDYWGLISSIPEAHFLVMIEHAKCGPDMKEALRSKGIFYCYIDEFYSGDSDSLKRNAIILDLYKQIRERPSLNLMALLNDAIWTTKAPMDDAEKKRFYDKYVKGAFRAEIDDAGNVTFRFGK